MALQREEIPFQLAFSYQHPGHSLVISRLCIQGIGLACESHLQGSADLLPLMVVALGFGFKKLKVT